MIKRVCFKVADHGKELDKGLRLIKEAIREYSYNAHKLHVRCDWINDGGDFNEYIVDSYLNMISSVTKQLPENSIGTPCVFIAKVDGVICASLLAIQCPEDISRIEFSFIYCLPSMRGNGIGKNLTAFAIRQYSQRNGLDVIIRPLPNNDVAIKTGMGAFKLAGIHVNYYNTGVK